MDLDFGVFKQLSDAYNARFLEMETTIMNNLSKLEATLKELPFITLDPGRQYTSSFNPIVGRDPKEFWGPLYIPFNRSLVGKTMYQLLMIRKFRQEEAGALAWLDINIMKMLQRCLIASIIFNWS